MIPDTFPSYWFANSRTLNCLDSIACFRSEWSKCKTRLFVFCLYTCIGRFVVCCLVEYHSARLLSASKPHGTGTTFKSAFHFVTHGKRQTVIESRQTVFGSIFNFCRPFKRENSIALCFCRVRSFLQKEKTHVVPPPNV